MKYSKFRNLIKDRVLLMDGAIGTALMDKGLKPGDSPEGMLLDAFEAVVDVHASFVKAGAQIVESNTFGANRIKLSQYGLAGSVEEINKRGIEAVKAAGGVEFVTGCIGPTGRFIEPVGNLSFDEAVSIFEEQASAMINAGADLICIETMSDIKEIKAAIVAIRKFSNVPIMAQMTFEKSGRTTLGTSAEAAAITLSALSCDLIGINCSLGGDGILPVMKRMRRVSDKPFIVEPNAGMPVIRNGVTLYPDTPEKMASMADEFIGLGVRVVGSCCGSTPAHTRALKKAIDACDQGLKNFNIDASYLSSRTSYVAIGPNKPVRIIGERINPTGRKILARDIKGGNFGRVRDDALSQIEAGADILDVNMGLASIDETRSMEMALSSVTSIVDVPVSIDSADPGVIKAGLKIPPGKSLINSVSGEVKSLENLLPLARLYGAAIIVLLMDENGPPGAGEDVSSRIRILEKILRYIDDTGISRKDIYVDALTMAVSSDVRLSRQTLETMRVIRKDFDLNLTLGISNISFGLPKRPILNSAFLAMAIDAGLDLAIINPMGEGLMDTVASSNVLAGRDHNASHYIERFVRLEPVDVEISSTSKIDVNSLTNAVIQGNDLASQSLAQKLMDEGRDPMEVSNTLLIPAMEEVGRLFDKDFIFLPQMLLSANAMKKAFDVIKHYIKPEDVVDPIQVILATVEGDVHDIGKNIVGVILSNNGFDVIDLGKNCPAKTILDKANALDVRYIGLSALMTTTLPSMGKTVQMLKDGGEFVVMVGGAVVDEAIATDMGADIYGKDAMDALRKLQQWLKESQR